MARPEKVQAVADIKERVEGSEAVFITEFAGLKVHEQQALRRSLRAADAEYKVFKMTLTRRAVGELGHDELFALLEGPTGLAFAPSDPVPAAKALRDFNRDHAALVIKGMLMAGRVLPPEQVHVLADIEPREVLLAKLAGAFQAPLSGFVGALSGLLRKTGYGFQALLDQRVAAGETLEVAAPDEPAAADEPEAADGEPEAAADGETEAAAESPESPESPESAESPDSPESPDEPDDEAGDDETGGDEAGDDEAVEDDGDDEDTDEEPAAPAEEE